MTVSQKGAALKPRDVVAKYAPLVGGPVNARQIIALGLREGTLKARAGKSWISTDPSLAMAWKNEPEKSEYVKPSSFTKEHNIKHFEWNKSVDFLNDILTWDFRTSRMHVTTSKNPVKRLMFRHVRLLDADVSNIFRFATEGKKSNFYRANKVDEWRRFWHEMIILAVQKKAGLKDSVITSFTNADDIVATVLNRLELVDEAINSDTRAGNQDLQKNLQRKLEFTLTADTLQKEVDLLREELNLKRRYASKSKNLGLNRINRVGSGTDS